MANASFLPAVGLAGIVALALARPAVGAIVSLGRGTPIEVARRIVSTHIDRPCEPVRATRRKDHTIRFTCPDGGAWLLFRERGFMPAIVPCPVQQSTRRSVCSLRW